MAPVLRFMGSSSGSDGGGDRTSTDSASSSNSSGRSSRSSSSRPLLSIIASSMRRNSKSNLSEQTSQSQEHADNSQRTTSPKPPKISKVPKHMRKSPELPGDDTAVLAALYQPGLSSKPIYFFPRHPKRCKSKSSVTAALSNSFNALKNDVKLISRRGSAPLCSTITEDPSLLESEAVSTLSLSEALASLQPPSPILRSQTPQDPRRTNSSEGRERHTAFSWITNRALTHRCTKSNGSSEEIQENKKIATEVPTSRSESRSVPLFTPLIPTPPSIDTLEDNNFLRDVLESTSFSSSEDTLPNSPVCSETEDDMSRLGFPRSRGATELRPDSAISGLMETAVDTSKLPPPPKDTMRFASPRSRGAPPKAPSSLFGAAEMIAMLSPSESEPVADAAMRFASPRSQAPRRDIPKTISIRDSKLESIAPSLDSPRSTKADSTMSGLTLTTTTSSTASRSTHSSGGRRKYINKDVVLEDYLGIYKSDQKLGVGRSGADEIASLLMSKFSRKSNSDSARRPRSNTSKGSTTPPLTASSSASSLRLQQPANSTEEQQRSMSVPDITVSSPYAQSSSAGTLKKQTDDTRTNARMQRSRSESEPPNATGVASKLGRTPKANSPAPITITDIPSLPNADDYAQRELPPVPPTPPPNFHSGRRPRHQRPGSQQSVFQPNKHKYTSSQDITNDLASWAESMFPLPTSPGASTSPTLPSPNAFLSPTYHLHPPSTLPIIGELPTPPPTATTTSANSTRTLSICTNRSSSIYSVPLSPGSPPSRYSDQIIFPVPPSQRFSRDPFEFDPINRNAYNNTPEPIPDTSYADCLPTEDREDELEAFLKTRPPSTGSLDALPENLDFLDAEYDDGEYEFYTPESCPDSYVRDNEGPHYGGNGDEVRRKLGEHRRQKTGDKLEKEIKELLRGCEAAEVELKFPSEKKLSEARSENESRRRLEQLS